MTYTNRRASSAYTYGIERVTHEDLQMGTMHHYMHDGRGSVANLTPQVRNGHMVRYSYDPFGNETRIGFTRSRFGYNAEHTDLTGMQYLRARYYNPNIGRFTSEDPFRGFLDVPISQNRYTYVHNNPINHIDPTGNVAALLAGAMAAPPRQPAPAPRVGMGAAVATTPPVINPNTRAAVNAPANPVTGSMAALASQGIVVSKANSMYNELQRLNAEYMNPLNAKNRWAISLAMQELAQQLRLLCSTAERIQPQLIAAGHTHLAPLPNINNVNNLPGVQAQWGRESGNLLTDFASFFAGISIASADVFIGGPLTLGAGIRSWASGDGFISGMQQYRANNITPIINNVRNAMPDQGLFNTGYFGASAVYTVASVKKLMVLAPALISKMPTIMGAGGVGALGQVVVISGQTALVMTPYFVLSVSGANNIGNAIRDSNTGSGGSNIKNTYRSIRESPNYPEGFTNVQDGMRKHKVTNREALEDLRRVEAGEWHKVYRDGFDAAGNRVSIHYFQSKSGTVFDVQVKQGWSNF
ncbi:MAG: RHS repeat-associated core domain-containing protein [Oscillospiraceae bacterium]|nr:RHS repeat-associated core domain-containing protein [Oscillospiraceae bacterium]